MVAESRVEKTIAEVLTLYIHCDTLFLE